MPRCTGSTSILLGDLDNESRKYLNQVRPVLHDRLEPDVLRGGLPVGNEVEHMLAVCYLSTLFTDLTCKFHTEAGEHRLVGGRILHLE